MEKTRKIVLLGDSAFAEVAYEYFTHDSEYEVAGFSVEREFLRRDQLFGLPVVPFEELEDHDSEVSWQGEGRTGQVALRDDCGGDKIYVHITNRPA